ncbi:hypothetical protein K0M31_006977, partial [Melipona bicolor]
RFDQRLKYSLKPETIITPSNPSSSSCVQFEPNFRAIALNPYPNSITDKSRSNRTQ